MKEVFKELALQAGGSHYPTVGGALLEKFGELVVQKCIESVATTDVRDWTYTTYDKARIDSIVIECTKSISDTFK